MAFLQLITDTEDLERILYERPTAFALLSLIAKRAKRNNNDQSDLKICEAMIGDFQAYGKKNTRQSYREDVKYLQKAGYISIRTTKKGTIAKIINQNLFNINPEVPDGEKVQNYNQQRNHQKTKSTTIKTTISKAKKNQTKKANFSVFNNHQNNQQNSETTTISATTNKKLSRNNITAENSSATDFQNLESIAEFFKNKFTPNSDGLNRQIRYDWQEKAERYANALGIDLEASFAKKPNGKRYKIAPSWFKIFNESAKNKNGKARRTDQAYSLFFDEPNWSNFSNEQKFKFILDVYHNGVSDFQNKYAFSQID